LGNPLRLALTAGQCHDITQAQALMDGFDKLASRYLGFLHFVGALIWLR
jgi:transposase